MMLVAPSSLICCCARWLTPSPIATNQITVVVPMKMPNAAKPARIFCSRRLFKPKLNGLEERAVHELIAISRRTPHGCIAARLGHGTCRRRVWNNSGGPPLSDTQVETGNRPSCGSAWLYRTEPSRCGFSLVLSDSLESFAGSVRARTRRTSTWRQTQATPASPALPPRMVSIPLFVLPPSRPTD